MRVRQVSPGGTLGLTFRADRDQLETSRLAKGETMTELNDRAYYAARAAEASELAETATDPEIAAIHRRMGESYRELVELTPENRRTLQIVEG